jgi:hypothetical protein
MRTRINLFWGVLLAFALLSTSLPAQDKGYWVLSHFHFRDDYFNYHHDFIEGTVTYTSSRSVATGGTMYMGAGTQEITDEEEIARLGHGFTENSMKVGLMRKSVVTWSTPPQTVKAGEEHLIKINASLDIGEKDQEYDVSVELERRDQGDYPPPDERDSHNDKRGSLGLDDSNTKIVNQNPWGKKVPMVPPFNHPKYYELELSYTSYIMGKVVSAAYVYKYVPDLKEVTTFASDEEGEDIGGGGSDPDSHKIPWGIIGVGIVGGGIVGARTLRKSQKNKKSDQKKSKKKKKEEENEEEHSTFRMVLYKEFGDTLVLGEAARMVGARIEEIKPGGTVVERPDLTARISIAAEEGCNTGNVRTQGRYKAADVSVEPKPDGSAPELAKVRFSFSGTGGMYINHVVFRVESAPELVMDESLTFAAFSNQTLTMEMGINGYAGRGDVEKLEISLPRGADEFFTARLTQDAENPRKFVATLTETGKLPPEEKYDPDAGEIEQYICEVSIYLRGLQDPVSGSFDLFRLHLGLAMDLRALKGYLVTWDSTYDHEILPESPEGRKKFGEAAIRFRLIVEEPETGQIKSVIPDKDPAFVFLDLPDESLLFLDKYGNQIQNLCESMKFQYAFETVAEDNLVLGTIHATEGGLLPPNRAKAKVLMVVSWHGQTYSQEMVVPIISQPFVDINDNRRYNEWLKDNQRKFEQLVDIRYKIAFDPRFNELMPFYYKVYALVEGYDPRFGIYEPDYNNIMRIFKRYCSGELGHYFVNDAVWKPTWTEADENFNAFMATWGSMEKSIPVIGMRIALGFFTAGASELVFTPMSALTRMQDYVNKGGDSAWEGFKVASKEVLFWEGVFYVGGKVFQYAKYRGWTDKAKDLIKDKAKAGYQKLKDIYNSFKAGKDSTKQLSGAKNVNLAKLGKQVQEGGKKVSQISSSSRTRANDAIRKTRSQGDKAFTKESILAEEAAKRARQDAKKILDHFEEVMNNPTASPEEMRRATLALQGNKTAQNLLRNHPSDILRANFNAQMQEMYKMTDPIAIKKMAERMGVPEGSIRTWNGASGNDAKELLYGRKIGADRDVTFQILDKDGKWVDLPEDVMEEAYSQAFNEVHYNFFPYNRKECIKTLQKFDQAVVNGKFGLESYGDDLGRIITKGRQAEKLVDPERVAKTFKHKCDLWLEQGKACREQAEQLRNAGFIDEALHVQGYGDALIEEGLRQQTKQFKRILEPRIQALASSGKAQDYSLLYEKIRVLESIGNPPPEGALSCTLEEARLTLQTQYGCTLEDVIDECANLIPEVNKLL